MGQTSHVPSSRVRLETPRLVLRPGRASDVGALLTALRKNAEHLRPWSPLPEPADRRPSLASAAREIARWRGLWQKDDTYALYVFARDRAERPLVGRLTLGRISRGVFQNAYLGYWMDHELQGTGRMTEAVAAALDFAFGPLGLHRVQAAIMPHNPGSIRVVEKCGFRREGFAERYLQIAGKWEDHVLFARTAEEHAAAAVARAEGRQERPAQLPRGRGR